MSTPELEEVRKYLMENLEKGYITLSDSPFTSSVLFVKKKDGSLRFYVNYRRVRVSSHVVAYHVVLASVLLGTSVISALTAFAHSVELLFLSFRLIYRDQLIGSSHYESS